MSYRFQDRLYRSEREMLDAIARLWLHCEDPESVTDAELARECFDIWGLDREDNDGWDNAIPSHADANGCYTEADLAKAFGRVRAELTAE